MPLVLVANQSLRVPPSRFIRTLRVAAGFDVADNEIVRQCEAGDLVITADIPLAAEAIEKGAAALNPEVARDFKTFGLPVYIGYGLTECSPLVIGNNDRLQLPDSVGVPLPGVEAKINAPDVNGVGEIWSDFARFTAKKLLLLMFTPKTVRFTALDAESAAT